MTDLVIISVCGTLFVILLIVLVWWLKEGKQRFIEKRCPERLHKNNNECEVNADDCSGNSTKAE